MSIKLIPDITLSICYVEPMVNKYYKRDLRWYHRDAKRIKSKKPWNSKKYNHVKDEYRVLSYRYRNGNKINWLLHVGSLYNIYGERRVTPMYEVELLEEVKPDYYKIKRK